MKPGLTGLWQVSGRGDLLTEEWMRMDVKYVDERDPEPQATRMRGGARSVLAGRRA